MLQLSCGDPSSGAYHAEIFTALALRMGKTKWKADTVTGVLALLPDGPQSTLDPTSS